MVKGAALFLQQGSSPQGQRSLQHPHKHAGDLPQHLQVMINLLRCEDRIKLVRRDESGRAPGERLGGAGPVYGGGGQQRAPGHGGEHLAGRRLFQQGEVSLMGQELLLEKESCGPVSLGVDGGMHDGGWRGDQEQQGTAFPLLCAALCQLRSLL
ncbi:uncharacterized protein LOC106696092 isoform X1 [Myotis lucifugus]|uniref:uncharacterized protein LOC106696092 isoform X1 n=1 Tax=Myotis lucifugus TaxID=59463 RepID=UPI0006D70404|nr:uncharacterized protein LOC106696092 isoform X1 [Myotis lucifugus]